MGEYQDKENKGDFDPNAIVEMIKQCQFIIVPTMGVDCKVCLELGAAVMYNKPIIFLSDGPLPKHILNLPMFKYVVNCNNQKALSKAIEKTIKGIVDQ